MHADTASVSSAMVLCRYQYQCRNARDRRLFASGLGGWSSTIQLLPHFNRLADRLYGNAPDFHSPTRFSIQSTSALCVRSVVAVAIIVILISAPAPSPSPLPPPSYPRPQLVGNWALNCYQLLISLALRCLGRHGCFGDRRQATGDRLHTEAASCQRLRLPLPLPLGLFALRSVLQPTPTPLPHPLAPSPAFELLSSRLSWSTIISSPPYHHRDSIYSPST